MKALTLSWRSAIFAALLASSLSLLLPSIASAASYKYDCTSDLSYSVDTTCTPGGGWPNDYFQAPTGEGIWSDNSAFNFPISNGQTVYVTVISVQGGDHITANIKGDTTDGSSYDFWYYATPVSEVPMTAGTDTLDKNYLEIDALAAGGGSPTVVYGVCIDDDGYSCTGGPPPQPPTVAAVINTQLGIGTLALFGGFLLIILGLFLVRYWVTG